MTLIQTQTQKTTIRASVIKISKQMRASPCKTYLLSAEMVASMGTPHSDATLTNRRMTSPLKASMTNTLPSTTARMSFPSLLNLMSAKLWAALTSSWTYPIDKRLVEAKTQSHIENHMGVAIHSQRSHSFEYSPKPSISNECEVLRSDAA